MDVIEQRVEVRGNPDFLKVQFRSHEPMLLPIRDWVRLELKVGIEVDDTQLAELEQIAERALFFDKALSYLRLRDRTQLEMIRYLSNKGASPNLAKELVATLCEQGYVNDAGYASTYVSTWIGTKSRAEITWKLGQLGISSSLVQEALQRMEDDVQQAEFAAAHRLAAKQWMAKRNKPANQRKQSIGRYLQSKGFPISVIYRVIDIVSSEEPQDSLS